MTIRKLIRIPEPQLRFGHGQLSENPKDGLFLFGPVVDAEHPRQLRLGVMGTPEGLLRYDRWAKRMRGFIDVPATPRAFHMAWPGFEAAFNCEWPDEPLAQISVDAQAIHDTIHITDRHEAVHKTVNLFLDPLLAHARREESRPTLWCVVIPKDVFRFGRNQSVVPAHLRQPSSGRARDKLVRSAVKSGQGLLLHEDRAGALLHQFSKDFHNQLKARLLDERVAIQILRDTTLEPEAFLNNYGKPTRTLEDEATRAWNLGVGMLFKGEGKPWSLAAARPGVCYIGLVFKRIPGDKQGYSACGAQMFLNSGVGTVFRGANGAWRSPVDKSYHLSCDAAANLIRQVLEDYGSRHDGARPSELFIHGRIAFSDDEWAGFSSAVDERTNLVGVRIRKSPDLKMFTQGQLPLLRGHALVLTPTKGFLWSSGFVPRLDTYPGWEVPWPLAVDIVKGKADIEMVLADVLALTKLNYNSAAYGSSQPVTLGFADAVGDILVAAPLKNDMPPLPFRYYM